MNNLEVVKKCPSLNFVNVCDIQSFRQIKCLTQRSNAAEYLNIYTVNSTYTNIALNDMQHK